MERRSAKPSMRSPTIFMQASVPHDLKRKLTIFGARRSAARGGPFDSGVLAAPCGGADNSSDVDRFSEIGLHIWSTMYLTIHGRLAVLKSGLV